MRARVTHFAPIRRYSAALFTTQCVENSQCNNGPWFFVVVTISGLALSLFFLVTSSKPDVSFFDGALQVLSLYFQIRKLLPAHLRTSLALFNSSIQWDSL
jgi:hypothetical protein